MSDFGIIMYIVSIFLQLISVIFGWIIFKSFLGILLTFAIVSALLVLIIPGVFGIV